MLCPLIRILGDVMGGRGIFHEQVCLFRGRMVNMSTGIYHCERSIEFMSLNPLEAIEGAGIEASSSH